MWFLPNSRNIKGQFKSSMARSRHLQSQGNIVQKTKKERENKLPIFGCELIEEQERTMNKI